MTVDLKHFNLVSATATVGVRSDGSAWVSVVGKEGLHYQCDFWGDPNTGPVDVWDFKYTPPSWVVDALCGSS